MSSIQGVLYLRNEKEELRWFEDVDPNTEDGENMQGKLNMVSLVVMEHSLIQMEKNMKVNGRMGKDMVKDHTTILMAENMQVNGMMEQEKVME